MASIKDVASPPDSDVAPDARRNCPRCNIRMSSLVYDQHSFCTNCRGVDCTVDAKCTECANWPKEQFDKYIRNKKNLEKKARSKLLKKEREREKKIDMHSDVSEPNSEGLGVDPLDIGDSASRSGGGLSEGKVMDLISNSLAQFSSTLAESMSESFDRMKTMIDSRFREISDSVNPSLPAPSPVQVLQTPSKGRLDPSRPRPQYEMPDLQGSVPAEPVQVESANIPCTIASFIDRARQAGLEIPAEVSSMIRESPQGVVGSQGSQAVVSGSSTSVGTVVVGDASSQGWVGPSVSGVSVLGVSGDGLGAGMVSGGVGQFGQGSLGSLGSQGGLVWSQGSQVQSLGVQGSQGVLSAPGVVSSVALGSQVAGGGLVTSSSLGVSGSQGLLGSQGSLGVSGIGMGQAGLAHGSLGSQGSLGVAGSGLGQSGLSQGVLGCQGSQGSLGVSGSGLVQGSQVSLGSQGSLGVAGSDLLQSGLSQGSQGVASGDRGASVVSGKSSSSGTARMVSFDFSRPSTSSGTSVVREEEEEADMPLSHESGQKNDSLKAVLKVVNALCPNSVHQGEAVPVKACEFEGKFAQLPRSSKYQAAPVLFERARGVLQETFKKFSSAAVEGKFPASSLPGRKKSYEVPDASFLHAVTPLNRDAPRVMKSISNKRASNTSIEELGKLEAVAKNAIECQSMAFWLFDTIINWLCEQEFSPSDPTMFEEVIKAFANAMVASTSNTSSLAAFCMAKRREAYLSHFFPSVGDHFKKELAASSFEGEFLFDESTLSSVVAGSIEDSGHKAQLSIAKALSFPVFGGKGSDRKASSDQDSEASTSSGAGRGRGRGAGSGSGGGQKRKTPPSPGKGRGRGKSPKRDNKKARGGKGFQA